MLSIIELNDFEREAPVDLLRDCNQFCKDMKDFEPHSRCTQGEVCVTHKGVFPSFKLDDCEK